MIIPHKWTVKIGKVICFFAVALFIIWIVQISSTSILRSFSYALVVLTIGEILDFKEKKSRKVLKYLIYITWMFYSLYNLGIFGPIRDLFRMSALDYTTIALGVLAPLCLMIEGKRIANIRIKGRKIFGYYTLWVLYFILVFVWDFLFPDQVLASFLIIYAVITGLVIYYFKLKTKKTKPHLQGVNY